MLYVLALSSVLAEFIAYAIIIQSSPLKGKHVSVSEHAASKRRLYLMLGVSSTLFGSVFAYYMYHTFGPEFGMPYVYYGIVVVNWVCMLLTAWIPYKPPKIGLQNPHNRAALGLAGTLTLIIVTLIFAHNVDTVIHVVAAIATVWYCFTIYLGLFRKQSLAQRLFPYFLVIELFNLLSIFGIILGVGFWGLVR